MSNVQQESIVATANDLQHKLALFLGYTHRSLQGELFTLIETLGMPEKQEKALKDSVKSKIKLCLSTNARHSLDYIVEDIGRFGVKQDNADKDSKTIEAHTDSSLADYSHWQHPLEGQLLD